MSPEQVSQIRERIDELAMRLLLADSGGRPGPADTAQVATALAAINRQDLPPPAPVDQSRAFSAARPPRPGGW